MLDRAAELFQHQREMAGCEDNVQFLHCNAYFLLGLSSCVDCTLFCAHWSKQVPKVCYLRQETVLSND